MNNFTKEDQSIGGTKQSQKVYHCAVCGGIGRGNRMVSDHLNGCKGMGRRLKKSTEDNSHRLQEAKANSELYFKERLVESLRKDYVRAKNDILDNIELLRTEFGAQFEASLEEYYTKKF